MDFHYRRSYAGALRAVILDWAGTTVDYGSMAPVIVFVEVFRRAGVAITPAEARGPMGLEKKDHIRAIMQLPAVAQRWAAAHDAPGTEADIEALFQDSVALQRETVAAHAVLIPGTLEAVAACRARGLRIGSTTGYSRAVMEVLVPRVAEQGYSPDAWVCPSDVPAGRPAPWMLFQNMIQLQVYPLAAVVKVGDTVPDIEEGLNAGTWTVGIAQTGNELGLTAPEVTAVNSAALRARLEPIYRRFRQAGAHYVLDTIAELPAVLDAIAAQVARGAQP